MENTLQVVKRSVRKVVMPKQDPTWRFALGSRPESLGLVLQLSTADGICGYGYASEIPHLGHNYRDVEQQVRHLAAKVAHVDPWSLRPQLLALRQASTSNPALAAVEMATLDLAAKAVDRPLANLLGGTFRRHVPILRILSIKSPAEMAEIARAHVSEGYRYLKIKIDNHPPDLDAQRVAAIREAVGQDVHLTLDANQSYDAEGAIALYEQVRHNGIDVFEQPVAADDLDAMRRVTSYLDCIVEADESANSIHQVWRLITSGSCSGISLKLPKLGGIMPAIEASHLCAVAGVRCRIGAHVGSRLLNAAALHTAAVFDSLDYACELGEFARLNDDPFAGVDVSEGNIALPERPGIGVYPLEE